MHKRVCCVKKLTKVSLKAKNEKNTMIHLYKSILSVLVYRFTRSDCRLQKFLTIMDRRAQLFDISGGILSTFPWLRYVAPEISGYKTLLELNNELKNLLLVILMAFIFSAFASIYQIYL